MKELEFIETIKSVIKNDYIGDDCAHLNDLGIVVTQDSLVEDIHFKRSYMSPYQIGKKAVAVNVSDVLASGAVPAYLTISLSLPKDIDKNFVEEFYKGAVVGSYGAEIVGGDITGGDKIFISISVIGKTKDRNISSRSGAKVGYKLVVSGKHGSSGAGLRLLLDKQKSPEVLIKSHIEPELDIEFSKKLSKNNSIEGYAMMDSSDGLGDALLKIAKASGVKIVVDFDKIPYDKEIEMFEDYKNLIFFGGEDYRLVAAVPQNIDLGYKIGDIEEGEGVFVKYNKGVEKLKNNSFDHFEK